MDEEEIDIFIKRLAKVLEKAKSEDIEGTNGKSTLLFLFYLLKKILALKVFYLPIQGCGSGLMVCGSGSGSTKFSECSSGSRKKNNQFF